MRTSYFLALVSMLCMHNSYSYTAIVACAKINPNNCWDVILPQNIDCEQLANDADNDPDIGWFVSDCWHFLNAQDPDFVAIATHFSAGDGYKIITEFDEVKFVNLNTNIKFTLIASEEISSLIEGTAKFLQVQNGVVVIYNDLNPFYQDRAATSVQPKLQMIQISDLLDKTTIKPSLYPNPATENLNIYIPKSNYETNSNFSFELIDVTGRIVFLGQVIIGKNQILLTDVPSGSFIYRIYSDKYGVIGTGYFNVE